MTEPRPDAGSSASQERLARAALSGVGEPDDLGLRRLVAAEGVVGAWASLRRGDGRHPEGRLSGLLGRARRAEPERDLERLAEIGGRLVCPGDQEWPPGLNDLDHLDQPAPFALWVRGGGDLRGSASRGVAVVGARAATAYGVRVAGTLSAGLAAAGASVVSGGAYGVDAAAHRGALLVGEATVVVLACGVDWVYPRGHVRLFEQVCQRGLLVSEAPPGTSPLRHRFLVRNRLIAALTCGTVVVEAAVRSGALNTAGHAERLSKPVMAVPGPVTSALSDGCHLLVRERNAVLVACAEHVLEIISPAGAALLAPTREPPRLADDLTVQQRQLLDAVPARAPASTGNVAIAAGVDPRAATGLLAALAGMGLVVRDEGGWRLSAADRTGRGAVPRAAGAADSASYG